MAAHMLCAINFGPVVEPTEYTSRILQAAYQYLVRFSNLHDEYRMLYNIHDVAQSSGNPYAFTMSVVGKQFANLKSSAIGMI